MQTENLEGQESIFGRDSGFGKMSSALSQVGGTLKRVKKSLGRIFKKSSKRSSKLKNHKVAPPLSARMGTGGLNTSLVQQVPEEVMCIAGNAIDLQPQNGGNGFGWQRDISYTLTTSDRHSVYARQRVDQFRDDEIASTESARQHKDATDLVCQPPSTWDADCRNLIRRLTPLECERLQGYPDGWTDVPGASDSARYKALGNSVAIPCVEYLMQRVAMVITLDLEWDF